jgi:hypothetical protein
MFEVAGESAHSKGLYCAALLVVSNVLSRALVQEVRGVAACCLRRGGITAGLLDVCHESPSSDVIATIGCG